MTRRLLIELTGDSPDLGNADEGVSLKFFASYTQRLREAYRRSAQATLTGTMQDVGRLPDRAAEVDVRLMTASQGSLHLEVAAVDMSRQTHLQPNTLPEDALAFMVQGMRETASDPESPTTPRAFRLLIGAVPPAVRQRYAITENGHVLDEVTITSTGFEPVHEPVIANLERVKATIKSITFAPRISIVLDVEGSVVKAAATPLLVDRAFSLRNDDDVVAVLVENSMGHRLLDLTHASEQFPKRDVPVDETVKRYAGILRELAK